MGHQLDIDTNTGKVSMFYYGGEPWHGLGTKLENPATAEEAITAANLGWKVKKAPLYAAINGKRKTLLPDYFAIIREDTKTTLGIVGQAYTPLQNIEAFKFFDPIVGKEAAVYHTAGSLDGGRRIWILAKLPETIVVADSDNVDKYLLLSNDHSGDGSVQIKFTPVRVVCQNTLTQALSTGFSVKVAHFKNIQNKFNDAARLLGIIQQNYDEVEKHFKQMVVIKMDDKRYDEYFSRVFPYPEKHGVDERVYLANKEAANNNRQAAEHLALHGAGNSDGNVNGTLWTAYNGVTEFIDHCQKVNRQNQESLFEEKRTDQKLKSIWFADGYYVKARAYDAAIKLMHDWKN